MKRFANQLVQRQALALLRLWFLFILACFLIVETGFWVRTLQDSGWDLTKPLPAINNPATHLPFLGITAALEQYTGAERRTVLARLHQSGFGWVRQRLDWGLLEPQPGHYNWHQSDVFVTDIVAAGLIPVFVLDGSPSWARAPKDTGATANPLAPPADPATFARFAANLATRYRGQVRFYQIWDEPNIAPHWGNRLIEPVGYAQLLKAAATAIRAADPAAVIITAALAPTRDRGHLAMDEVYFLQRLYAAGAAPFFDGVAVQPFGFGYAPDDERARLDLLNFQRVKLIRRAMLAAGDGEKPIWAVRYGWNIRVDSPWRTVRPDDQVAFATAALTLARQQWPWLTAMGWAIDQPPQPHSDPNWGFALTPELADAFRTWQTKANSHPSPQPIYASIHWRWAGFLGLWLLVGWRTIAALSILPWAQWRQRYRAWPWWIKISGWLALVLLYTFATWPPLVVLCWIIAVFFLLGNPAVGLALVALVLPFYFQHKEIMLAGTLVKIPPAHAALGCLWVALLAEIRLPYREEDRKSSGIWRISGLFSTREFAPHWLDGLALCWLVISLLTSVNVWQWPAYVQGLVNLTLLPILAYVATRLLVTTPHRQTLVSLALLGSGCLVAMTGLVLWWRGEGTLADGILRLVGPYFSPNHTALYLERIWWLGLGLTLSTQGVWRRWLLGALGLIGIALLLTASRGAWVLGMPAGAALFLWKARLWQRNRLTHAQLHTRRTLVIGTSIGVLIIILLGLVGGSVIWERLTNSATVAERLIIWQATLRLWQAYWLLGVGPGGFFWRYPSYLHWSMQSDPNLLHPHNLWLEVLAGWGIIGLLWLFLFIWQAGRMVYRIKVEANVRTSWQALGLFAALAAGVVHGQVDTFAALPDLAVWNWLALGLLVALRTTTTDIESMIPNTTDLIRAY